MNYSGYKNLIWGLIVLGAQLFNFSALAIDQGNYRVLQLLTDGKGRGLVQLDGASKVGIYSFDWLWLDGETLYQQKGHNSGPDGFSFSDSNDSKVDVVFGFAEADKERLTPATATYECELPKGKSTSKFTAATSTDMASLESALHAGMIKVTLLPTIREVKWIASETRNLKGKLFVVDERLQGIGPETRVYSGRARKLTQVPFQFLGMMCGIDETYTFTDGSKLQVYRKSDCHENSGDVKADWIMGNRSHHFHLIDPKSTKAKALGIDPDSSKVSTKNPCSLD